MKRRVPDGASGSRRSARVALSLTDVIVLVVTMAVLTAWLLPATAGVARSSKKNACLNNLMRIGFANQIYAAQDSAGMALPVHPAFFAQDPDDSIDIGPYEWGGKSGIGESGFVAGPGGDLAFLTSRYGTRAGFGPASRPLNKILYAGGFQDHLNPSFDMAGAAEDTMLDLPEHRCPSDSGYSGIHHPPFRDERHTSYDHYGTSYTANMFMTSIVGGGPVWSNSPYLHSMSELLSPSSTLAFQENNGAFAWATDPNPCVFVAGLPGTVRGWHGKDWTFNAAFLDGHADAIYMRSYRSARVILDDHEQDRSRCIIIRGDGWQKDTLPVPPAITDLAFSGLPSDRPSLGIGVE